MEIIILMLDLQKIFVYACSQNDKSDYQIMLEAEIYYDYLKKYKPTSILQKIETDNPLDIDKYVKQYMIEYGVDHVRGGTYYQEDLSEDLLRALLCELDTVSTTINKKNEEMIANLIDTYAFKQMTKDEIQEQYILLANTYENYKREKQLYESIKINGFQMINDIIWIKNISIKNIEMYKENKENTFLYKMINKEYIKKYREVLLQLKKLYDIFMLTEHSHDPDINIYVKHPEFLLDDFFYHWHRIQLDEQIKQVKILCNTYEYMTNVIINKMSEKKFDMSSWGEDLDWKIPRALYLLDKMM